ncbi:MAG: zinc dependent phospholipase C family protein [Vicingaceae bacterium]
MNRLKYIGFCITLLIFTVLLQSWGFYGHRRINRMAVFTLPPEMIGFYKANIEYVTAHAVDPDKRRYATKGEAPKHFIDIDHYGKEGDDPFKAMPKYWYEAVNKYSEDTLQAYGIVPWQVANMTRWLTKAFEAKDANRILYLSSDLGHYIADAHVPLHTTENYNGQMTGQKGIHGLWESRIPELTADDYDYLVGRAQYIKSPLNAIWKAVEKSHSYLDSVLYIEKDLTREFPTDQKYAFETRGMSTVRQYSQEFALAYDKRMGDMVESRMRKAISMVGSLWYTAWVNAGQPNLDELLGKIDVKKLEEKEAEEQKLLEKEKVKSREHEN